MIYVQIFLAFFIPGILGYGGGPASIPLVENEVVDHYGWLTTNEFSEMLAMGNALPGPIATKMAGYIGYEQGGILGAIVGVFATVAPSLILMIALLGLLMKYKESPRVKRMTTYIRPVIAVLLGIMTYDFFFSAYEGAGIWQTLFIGLVSFFLMERLKVHPAYVIAGALVYGGLVLG
ncbi:chromate transporter [Cytobacillus firmus]|jgi:chromate transporter|uniref:chromate transporter n=1 Tax=Bacillaceae TaxID=186817 RepID=UPI0013D1997D|nr:MULTISPECIES: chromate transporter [Bacillaceae]MBG9444622.1 transporter [Cytobacillus firmus]MBY6052181.1 chromate transporter [Cytobacillus firmus]MCU1807036.1 chromate transporter [Cytobacillus firmus]USK38599.1 chromate transporter [Cytobacillus firmus]